MKISAIAGRRARRDFVDLYVPAMEYGLEEILSLFEEKFARVGYSRLHLLKSLVYFEDAEEEPMPAMLRPLSWEEITRYLTSEVKKLP